MGVAVGKGGIEVGEGGGELELVMGIWVGLLGLSGKVGGGDEGGRWMGRVDLSWER